MVYIVHFDKKLYRARHYVGYTKNIENRMKKHRDESGAKILKRLNELGIKYDVVRVWRNAGPALEKQIKRHKNTKHYCPVCSKNPRNPRNIDI